MATLQNLEAGAGQHRFGGAWRGDVDEERRALEMMSVFPGGATLDTAKRVLTGGAMQGWHERGDSHGCRLSSTLSTMWRPATMSSMYIGFGRSRSSSPTGPAEIAARLFVTAETVKTHLGHLCTELGLRNRAALAAVLLDQPTEPDRSCLGNVRVPRDTPVSPDPVIHRY